jgi:hypothetical protein
VGWRFLFCSAPSGRLTPHKTWAGQNVDPLGRTKCGPPGPDKMWTPWAGQNVDPPGRKFSSIVKWSLSCLALLAPSSG